MYSYIRTKKVYLLHWYGMVMRITQEGDYALRVVLDLYRYSNGGRVEAKVISAKENIPLRFLLKLLRKLSAAGIIRSYRGTGGGYAIDKPPSEVTVRQVIEAIEGPITVNRCLGDPAACNLNRTSTCGICHVLGDIQQKLVSNMDDATFETVLKAHREK